MRRARLVVIRTGPTPGLRWEIDQANRLVPPERLVFVSPPTSPIQWSPRLDSSRRPRALVRLIAGTKQVGEIVLFDHTPQRHVVPIVARFRPRSFLLVAWRPYLECMEFAFQRAFGHLGLPWTEQKSRATASLLALVFGVFGLHQFYLGNRRRGLWYLAFCWTGVPVILGWIDLIRLVMGGDERFRERFVAVAAPAATAD